VSRERRRGSPPIRRSVSPLRRSRRSPPLRCSRSPLSSSSRSPTSSRRSKSPYSYRRSTSPRTRTRSSRRMSPPPPTRLHRRSRSPPGKRHNGRQHSEDYGYSSTSRPASGRIRYPSQPGPMGRYNSRLGGDGEGEKTGQKTEWTCNKCSEIFHEQKLYIEHVKERNMKRKCPGREELLVLDDSPPVAVIKTERSRPAQKRSGPPTEVFLDDSPQYIALDLSDESLTLPASTSNSSSSWSVLTQFRANLGPVPCYLTSKYICAHITARSTQHRDPSCGRRFLPSKIAAGDDAVQSQVEG
jgi:hypothetical protein